MKKVWQNPEVSNLSLNKTNEGPTTYPMATVACSCCYKVFYDKDLGLGGNLQEDPEYLKAVEELRVHELTVHANGCSA